MELTHQGLVLLVVFGGVPVIQKMETGNLSSSQNNSLTLNPCCFYRQNDFLAELKRSLPRDRSLERGNSELFRPSSVTRVHSRSTASTPAFYSSDDDDFDTEVEALETAYESPYGHGPRSLLMGRRVERVQSDTLFDRMQRAASSQNYARIGSGSESQRATPGFPTCPPTPYLNRPHSPAKPPRSPKSTTRSTHSTPTTPTT